MIEWMLSGGPIITNWNECAWAAVERLRRQVVDGPLDAELRALVAVAEEALEGTSQPSSDDLVICPKFLINDQLVSTIGLAARFEASVEVTLADLRVELFCPTDEHSEQFFRAGTLTKRRDAVV